MINEEATNIDQNPIEPEEMADNLATVEEIVDGVVSEVQGEPNANVNKEIQDLKDKYLRLLAEFENFKKRTSKERIEFSKFASQELITALLPILDDFDREVKAGEVTDGSKLIHAKLLQLLKQKGLEEMNTNGEHFDAFKHEAITEFSVSEDQKNKIIDTAEKGYYLHDKIIRYAKVVVGK